MATIDVGGQSGRRSVQRDLPLVPFIDFLLCILAFLLVTAVWTKMARLEADALVPGDMSTPPEGDAPLTLHVEYDGSRFGLIWRQGTTVVAQDKLKASPVVQEGTVTYPGLASAVAASWAAHARSTSPDLRRRTRAVVHTPNDAPFQQVVAVMDAVAQTSLPESDVRAFEVAFATD